MATGTPLLYRIASEALARKTGTFVDLTPQELQQQVVAPTTIEQMEPTTGGAVLTDPFSFAPTTGNGGAVQAIFNAIGAVGSILGAPSATTQLAQLGRPPGGGGIVGPQVEVQTGMPISAAGLACTVKRRRYKIVRLPDGSIAAQAYCLPRRMNPLNPRALARAGRRVASFSRIAQGMQKMLERSCRIGMGRKRSTRSRSYSCPPSRCK